MRTEVMSEEIVVGSGELRVLENRATHVLICGEGRVWLTEEGLAEDVVLQAGDCYCVRGEGKLLLEAAGEARLLLRRRGFSEAGRESLAA